MKDTNKNVNGVNSNDPIQNSVNPDVEEVSIEKLQSEIRELALTINKVEDEKAEIEEKLKKSFADYLNLEKSMNDRVELRMIQLKKAVSERLIEIMDDIKFGQKASEKLQLADETKSWMEGISSSLSKMDKALAELGITFMEVKEGDRFDSAQHEAIGVIPEGEDGTVYEVIQPGYLMGEVVIRAARVIVSKKVN